VIDMMLDLDALDRDLMGLHEEATRRGLPFAVVATVNDVRSKLLPILVKARQAQDRRNG
jgi:hypothetical protein